MNNFWFWTKKVMQKSQRFEFVKQYVQQIAIFNFFVHFELNIMYGTSSMFSVLFFFSLPKKGRKKASLMVFFCKINWIFI